MFKGTVGDQDCLTVVDVKCTLGEISASTKIQDDHQCVFYLYGL